MATTTRAITPTGPFSTAIPTDAPTSRSLAPLVASAASALRASASPRSQRSSMSPRASPQPPPAVAASSKDEQVRDDKSTAAAATAAAATAAAAAAAAAAANDSTIKAARDAAAKLSQPLAAVAKNIVIPENGTSSNLQASPVSMSSFGSVDVTTAPTTTAAPAVATVLPPQIDPTQALEDPNSRPAVDPGITGAADGGHRALTFPPPLVDEHHATPVRNMSLPTSGYSGGSPKTGSAAKRHKCPYCSTVFTRHHNLKSHLLTHSQEKPYECQQCNSRFRRLHDLKRHTKLHTGERPHECPQCGRKFARGDALARHTKGQGGCAGRRSSFGVDDDSMDRTNETMDGVEYTAEPEHMDDEEMDMDERRRVSEPSKKGNAGRQDSYRHSSTYPGPNVAPMYPPNAPRSRDPSISSQGPLSSIQHFNASGQGVFPQSSMTESPKPISPGQSGEHRGNVSAPNRGLSGYGQGAGAGRGTSPIGLPPPTSAAGGPQLPSLHSFPHMPSGPHSAGSHPGSLSSHSGSGGSTREMLGANNDVWTYVRELEGRMNRQQEDHNAAMARLRSDYNQMDNDYRSQISGLNEEIKRLKGRHEEATEAS